MRKLVSFTVSVLCPTKNMIYAVYINSEDNKKFTSISEFNWNAQEQAIYETEHNILRLCENPYDRNSLYGIVSSPEMAFSLAKIEF